MIKRWFISIVILALTSFWIGAADSNHGTLDTTSTGVINISLRINEEVRAGLLGQSGNTENDLRTLISSGLVQGLNLDSNAGARLSLCVESTRGGTFEVTSHDLPGETSAFTRFGEAVPLQVGFGAQEEQTLKLRGSNAGCDPASVIPVTIHLQEDTGTEVGRIHGKLKLLVKSE